MMKWLGICLSFVLVGSAFSATLVLQPGSEGKDAHIRSGSATYNGGSTTSLTINWGPTQENRGIVEFDLSPCNGATINSAYIDLYNRANTTNDTFGLYRVLASWAEMAVTWGNQPGHFATAYSKMYITGTGHYNFDVKTMVQEWASGTYTNYGFILKKDNELKSPYPYFSSSDHSTADYRPKITVDYTPSAIAPTSMGKVKALFR
jgi:hypothetical protein